jgi:hypothetical protein
MTKANKEIMHKLEHKLEKKDTKIKALMDQLNDVQSKCDVYKRDLTKEKYPEGGMVYAIYYPDNIDNLEVYRIGMTTNMNKRKQVYDTHNIHSRQVVHHVETACPEQLELCIRAALYKKRYRDNKDMYVCNLVTIKKTFETCTNCIKCVDMMNGGANGHEIPLSAFTQPKLELAFIMAPIIDEISSEIDVKLRLFFPSIKYQKGKYEQYMKTQY